MHLAVLRTLSSLAPGGLTTVARLPPRLPSSRPRIPLGTNTTLAQNAHRSELTRSLSSDKNSRQSVHDYKPRPAPHSLGSPVTVEAPAHWRSLQYPLHLGLVAAHSVAGEDAAAVFDVGAAAAHTGDTLDNTALLPCPAQLMGQGTRHRGNTPPDTRPPSVT